jgi:uncharacterized protein with NAD-binding domain and iron-sulfur cluster
LLKAAVIGGGFAGLSAALALQERGTSVVLLERRGVLGGRASASLDARTGDEIESGGHRLSDSATATRDLLRRTGFGDAVSATPRWSDVHRHLGDRFVSEGGRLRRRALATACDVEAGRLRRLHFVQRAETKLEMQAGKREVEETLEVDAVVAAVPWHALGSLVADEWRSHEPFVEAARLAAWATVTVHLWVDGEPTALEAAAPPFDWVSDRTLDPASGRRHYSLQTGLLAAMPRGSNAEWIGTARLALRSAGGPSGKLEHALVLREPFALAATPGGRLGPETPIQGLFVCGDWTLGGALEGGIEAAVKSGLDAARAIGPLL